MGRNNLRRFALTNEPAISGEGLGTKVRDLIGNCLRRRQHI